MKPIRIGSRDSALATWQAKEVKQLLANQNIPSEIVFIKSIGDLVKDKPLHTLGTVGVFTKALDDALLLNQVDIAVHSCKDLPSTMHDNLQLSAFLPREDSADVLVSTKEIDFLEDEHFSGIFATGSVRRKAQLLAKFPKSQVVNLRGNVPTRLQKLHESKWSAAVFAYAGLKRLGIEPSFYTKTNFMIPAPTQGIVAVACRKEDKDVIQLLRKINHSPTEQIATVEREFLHLMEGGCISPIGAHATFTDHTINLQISVLSTKGEEKVEFSLSEPRANWKKIARLAYNKAEQLGATRIIKEIEQNA